MCVPSRPRHPFPGDDGAFFRALGHRREHVQGVIDTATEEACGEARAALIAAHEACLVALGNHYGHPAGATPADVLAAVNTLSRLAFDAGAEFARASLIPPPPSDPEVVSAAEALIRALRPTRSR
jgi:hypothetical protein